MPTEPPNGRKVKSGLVGASEAADRHERAKDYETLPEVSEAMVTLAAIRLMLHRLAHPNHRRLPAP